MYKFYIIFELTSYNLEFIQKKIPHQGGFSILNTKDLRFFINSNDKLNCPFINILLIFTNVFSVCKNLHNQLLKASATS